MENRFYSNYFIFVRLIGILCITVWGIVSHWSTIFDVGEILIIGAFFLLCTMMAEMDSNRKRSVIWRTGEGLLAVAAVILFAHIGIILVAMFYLDVVEKRKVTLYLPVYLLLFVSGYYGLEKELYILIISFMVMIYFQHNKIIGWYQRTAKENLEVETRLKSDIEHNRIAYNNELHKSRLQHENEMLEEKSRIAQALHDKLGHSINGSLYQLEAAKLLIDKKPEQSREILQEVIDNLRGSMDEIRVILRNERPDKKKMALKSLYALCNECEELYGIKTSLNIERGEREIPDKILDIILDNTFEAVTNSLKYSGCSTIDINIMVLGEVVRCTVKDNGRGAENYEDGMGIQGMKRRVRSVKGYLDIESEFGFTINMILPINEEVNNGSDKNNNC